MRTCVEARKHTLVAKFYTAWIRMRSCCCCLWKTERCYLFHTRRLVELRHAHKVVFPTAWLPCYLECLDRSVCVGDKLWRVVVGPTVPLHLCSPVTCWNPGKPAPILKCLNPHWLATCACFMIVVMGYPQTIPTFFHACCLTTLSKKYPSKMVKFCEILWIVLHIFLRVFISWIILPRFI